MSFILPEYRAPDFSQARFQTVPDAILRPAPRDGVAPEGYHAVSYTHLTLPTTERV